MSPARTPPRADRLQPWPDPPDAGRRALLRSVLLAGAWWIGPPAAAQAPSAPTPAPPPGFSPWLRLDANGRVTAYTWVSDIGQGTWAALRGAVAQQLALDVAAVQIEQAPLEPRFHNPFIRNYATFGSIGVRTGVAVLRPAAAAARTMLVDAAAARWGVPAADCAARAGMVHHDASGRRAAYTELLAEASLRQPPEKPVLLTGAPPPVPAHLATERVDGSLRYGIDVQRPGMRYAAVAHAPTFGGRLLALRNEAAVAARPGVENVVPLPGGVAVVARSTWQALQAAAAVQADWAAGPHPALDSDTLRRDLHAAAQAGAGATLTAPNIAALSPDRTAAALAAARRVVDVSFDVPFLAHATMEPLSATVQVHADGAELWLSTQSPMDTQQAVARLLEMPPERVRLHLLPAGGGFGRRLEHDWVLDAVRVARARPGVPVQTVWRREVELRAGRYRPAAAARVRIAMDATGGVSALRCDMAHPSLLEYSGLTNGPKAELDWSATMGWLGQPYAVPAMHLTWTRVDRGVPCGYWRSVGASQNSYFHECALDLAARESGQDPLALRRRLLAGHPRGLAFVNALAEAGRWSSPLPSGHARGLAMAAANNSYTGHVAEVQIVSPGRYRLVHVTAVIDCGTVLDRRAVEAQLAGGTLFGLSAALAGEITLKDGQVEQGNFDTYPVVRLAQQPPMTVVVMDSAERAGGVGEEGVATIAPAIANALLAATGQPVPRLPLTRAGWTLQA